MKKKIKSNSTILDSDFAQFYIFASVLQLPETVVRAKLASFSRLFLNPFRGCYIWSNEFALKSRQIFLQLICQKWHLSSSDFFFFLIIETHAQYHYG